MVLKLDAKESLLIFSNAVHKMYNDNDELLKLVEYLFYFKETTSICYQPVLTVPDETNNYGMHYSILHSECGVFWVTSHDCNQMETINDYMIFQCSVNSERSDECIDFTMMCVFFVSMYSITRQNNAPISNFGVNFQWKSEYY
ncbi:Uncharacterized protein FWK35_00015713 [Aphis craccivora]|uniref:Uncharacterized protein n=1 Tax=Aphis craccivora TaxID=307492 RepID=A0A6G0ZHL0_APHCR|nr:Uncharacterized protein FWK35_00015713 [Aphis craccivora]